MVSALPRKVPSSRRASWAAAASAGALVLAAACSDGGVTNPPAPAVGPAPAELPSGIATGPLTNGGNDFGNITAAGQTDVWTFTGNANTPVAISMGELSGTANFNPRLQLVAPNGTVLQTRTAATVVQINAILPQAGTYTVRASSNGGVGTGNYQLILMKAGAFVVPSGDNGGHLNTNGTNQPGTITIGDLDRFTFNASAGSPLTVTMTKTGGTADFRPWIRLVSPTGAIIASASGASSAVVNIAAPQTGLYTVAVGTNDTGNDGTGTYNLSVTGAFTYNFSGTWGAITPTGPTGRQVTLTLAMDMGPAPGRTDINGNAQDELIGIQYTLAYDGALLQYDSRLGLDPNLDLIAVASPTPGVTNVAQTSQQALTSHGAVQLLQITYNIPVGASGTVNPAISFVEVLAGLVSTPLDVRGDVVASLPALVIP
jgi:hypothetical protein